MRDIKQGSADQSVIVRFLDDQDGTPETAVDYDLAGLELWYRREGSSKVTFAAASLVALNSAHADGGIKHVSDGYYRLDGPDAAYLAGANGVMFGGSAPGMVVIGCYVALVTYDPQDARLGMIGMPSVAPGNTGGLATHDVASAIKAKTDYLPSASAGTNGGLATHIVTSGTATIASQVNGKVDVIDSVVDAIKERTDSLPDSPAATSDVDTVASGISVVDGKVTNVGGVVDGILALMGDFYYARIIYVRDQADTEDKYAVQWFKNRETLTSGATEPKINVVKFADGTDLIPQTAMTQIGAIGAFKCTAVTSQRLSKGEMGVAEVRATIDGAERVWREIVGRDSN